MSRRFIWRKYVLFYLRNWNTRTGNLKSVLFLICFLVVNMYMLFVLVLYLCSSVFEKNLKTRCLMKCLTENLMIFLIELVVEEKLLDWEEAKCAYLENEVLSSLKCSSSIYEKARQKGETRECSLTYVFKTHIHWFLCFFLLSFLWQVHKELWWWPFQTDMECWHLGLVLMLNFLFFVGFFGTDHSGAQDSGAKLQTLMIVSLMKVYLFLFSRSF